MDLSQLLERSLLKIGVVLPPPVQARLLLLQDELLRWTARVNLTAITDPEEAIEKHLVDSLTILGDIDPTGRLLDLGSGGGFPGLPLRLAAAELRVLSVDAVLKKITFQRHMVRQFGLDGFVPWHGRAEEVPARVDLAAGFDRIVSRAFTSLEQFARLALPCLAQNGRIVAMKGAEGEGELGQAEPVLAELGLFVVECRGLTLPVSGARRTVIVLGRY